MIGKAYIRFTMGRDDCGEKNECRHSTQPLLYLYVTLNILLDHKTQQSKEPKSLLAAKEHT